MPKVKGTRPESKGANLKKYRKLYAEAKRRGLVRGNHDARSIKPSSYMKTKLNKLSPYMDSNYQAVKVSPKVARAFKSMRGANVPVVTNNRVLVRTGSTEQAVLRKGYPAKVQRLKAGTYEEIILPVQIRTFKELEEAILGNPVWDDILKDPDENFRFTFGGSIENGAPSISAYDNLEELIADLSKYHWTEDTTDGEEIGDVDDFEFEGVFHIYREYKDWNFPEYYEAQRKRRGESEREYARKREERKRKRLAALPESEREKIRAKRYRRRTQSKSYLQEIAKRREDRKGPKGDAIRKKDAERKRKQRQAAKAKGIKRNVQGNYTGAKYD